jgi:sugar phosphate isomerase/epimerase
MGAESGSMDRRGFLSRMTCGAAAVAVPCWGGEPRPAEERWPLRLSTSTVEFSSLSIEAALERIAKLGFEAVDFWHGGFGCPHLDEIEKRLGPAGLKDLLAKHKLKLYAISCYNVGYPRYAELLGKAGGGVAVRESRHGKVSDLKAEMKAFLDGLKPDLELAEKNDSWIAIENHGDALLDSLDSFKAFADLNRHPRLGIALAPYHLQIAKIPVEEVIGIAGKSLFFFYAWQHGEGLKQLPGVGPADFTPWIAALAKARYRWYVNPFMHGHPGPEEMAKSLARSVEYLKECRAKEHGLDPDRFGAWGASAGGHLAAMLGTAGDAKDLEGEGGNPAISSRVRAVGVPPAAVLAQRRGSGTGRPTSSRWTPIASMTGPNGTTPRTRRSPASSAGRSGRTRRRSAGRTRWHTSLPTTRRSSSSMATGTRWCPITRASSSRRPSGRPGSR